ncbi:unnamed protein product [Ectocarpus sp. 12 AP-2014]
MRAHEFCSILFCVRLEGLALPFGALPSRTAVRGQRGQAQQSVNHHVTSTAVPRLFGSIRGGFCHDPGAPSSAARVASLCPRHFQFLALVSSLCGVLLLQDFRTTQTGGGRQLLLTRRPPPSFFSRGLVPFR